MHVLNDKIRNNSNYCIKVTGRMSFKPCYTKLNFDFPYLRSLSLRLDTYVKCKSTVNIPKIKISIKRKEMGNVVFTTIYIKYCYLLRFFFSTNRETCNNGSVKDIEDVCRERNLNFKCIDNPRFVNHGIQDTAYMIHDTDRLFQSRSP